MKGGLVMNPCRSSFPKRTFFICLALAAAVLTAGVLELRGQSPKKADPFQKISFERKDNSTCSIPADGEVTALVKNGVELSVTEDFDCDGVADAYDNCVGMPNRDQADSNRNGIGDFCEAATIVVTGLPVKTKVSAKKPEPKDKERGKSKRTTAASDKKHGKSEKEADKRNKRLGKPEKKTESREKRRELIARKDSATKRKRK